MREFRCGVAAATLAFVPLLGGCVSAVDETSAFGFSQTETAEVLPDAATATEGSVSEGDSDTANGSEPAVAEKTPDSGSGLTKVAESAVGVQVAENKEQSPASQTGSEDAAKDATNEGGIRPTALMSRVSNPAVAAYAAPATNVKQADRSLYASLFTQSEAKTPLKNAEAGKSRRVVVLQTQGTKGADPGFALPGVDAKSLFEIGQRASVDSELLDDIDSSYQLASLTGIARLAPSGLMVQRDDVVTNCFDSNLMGLISQIEMRFKQKVVITSGFRSPAHNRRVRGAKASMHMACKAADLHVPGVNGLEVARFVRALPNRGGVGTYCHTSAIHVDVGSRRDWNWPCRRRQAS